MLNQKGYCKERFEKSLSALEIQFNDKLREAIFP